MVTHRDYAHPLHKKLKQEVRSLTFTLDALMMGTNQTGILILGIMNDVVKRDLLEQLQVRPGVTELEVMPIRFFSEVYGMGGNTKCTK